MWHNHRISKYFQTLELYYKDYELFYLTITNQISSDVDPDTDSHHRDNKRICVIVIYHYATVFGFEQQINLFQ